MNSLKSKLRKKLLESRKNLSSEMIKTESLCIQNQILKLSQWKAAQKIGLYSPILKEVETDLLLSEGLKSKKKIYYPKVKEENLDFYQIFSQENLKIGSFGVLEPQIKLPKLDHQLDLLIVPGIAFNHQKYRIGYGKGFYDRNIKKITKYSVGICYQSYLLSENFEDKWDIPVDHVIKY